MDKSKIMLNFAPSNYKTPAQEDKVGTQDMAKYTVTYKCGCTEDIQLYGKYTDREKKIAYYNTIECPHCRAAQAQGEAEKCGMPILKGTEKQIAWALDIRANAIKYAEELRKMTREGSEEIVNKLLTKLFAEDKGSFWIENRNDMTDKMSIARFITTNYKK